MLCVSVPLASRPGASWIWRRGGSGWDFVSWNKNFACAQCLVDTEPRRLSADEYYVLSTCASASIEGWKGCMQGCEALLTPRCLVDTEPRRLTVDDYRVLNNCAEMVVRRLEAERFAIDHAGAATQVDPDAPDHGVVCRLAP